MCVHAVLSIAIDLAINLAKHFIVYYDKPRYTSLVKAEIKLV